MKKRIAVFLCVFAVSLLCACGAAKLKPDSLKESEYNGVTTNDKVQLEMDATEIDSKTESITLTLKNLTGEDYTYDAAQRLELESGGTWRIVPNQNDAVPLVLYTLPAQSTETMEFLFTGHYAGLPDGRYRIVVPLVASDGTQALASATLTIRTGN